MWRRSSALVANDGLTWPTLLRMDVLVFVGTKVCNIYGFFWQSERKFVDASTNPHLIEIHSLFGTLIADKEAVQRFGCQQGLAIAL